MKGKTKKGKGNQGGEGKSRGVAAPDKDLDACHGADEEQDDTE